MSETEIWFITGSNSSFERLSIETVLVSKNKVATTGHAEQIENLAKHYSNNIEAVALNIIKVMETLLEKTNEWKDVTFSTSVAFLGRRSRSHF